MRRLHKDSEPPMPDPSFALRKAIHARLGGDAALAALLPPAQSVFDEVPRGREPPYVALGEGTVKDWSTASDRGHEHQLVLAVVVASEGGVRQVFAIADAVVRIARGDADGASTGTASSTSSRWRPR